MRDNFYVKNIRTTCPLPYLFNLVEFGIEFEKSASVDTLFCHDAHSQIIGRNIEHDLATQDKVTLTVFIEPEDLGQLKSDLELLARAGFSVPEPGDLYVVKCGWHTHMFEKKRNGPANRSCKEGDLIMITAVDLAHRVCHAVLTDCAGETYTSDMVDFQSLYVMTNKLKTNGLR